MSAEIDRLAKRRAWTQALRDPNRKQLKGSLERVNEDGTVSQCCLGVLCELSGAKRVPQWHGGVIYSDESRFLPSVVSRMMGFGKSPHVRMSVNGVEYSASLTYLNDAGVSFSEIADLIDEQAVDWDGGYDERLHLPITPFELKQRYPHLAAL